jgi:hypothetical protein
MNKYSNNKKTYIKRDNVPGMQNKKTYKEKLLFCKITPGVNKNKIEIVDSNWYSLLKK